MPIDLTALAAELTTDPLGVGYSQLTDAPCADALNTPNRPYALSSLPQATVLTLGNTFKAHKFTLLASDQTVPDALSYLIDGLFPDVAKQDSVDLTLPQVVQMIAAIQQMGLLTQEEVTALTTGTRSRAEELFGQAVDHMDVGRARLGANE